MCKITDKEIQQDGVAVSEALDSIATVLATTNPTLGAQLLADSAALLEVTNNWSTGSLLADFNTAASAVEATLGLIPETSALVPYIEIAVTALDILITNIGGSPATGGVGSEITVQSVKNMQDKIAALPPNPYRGKIQIERHHFQSPRSAIKNAWNAEVDKDPVSGIVKIS